MQPNWKIVVVSIACMAVLTLGAWRGAVQWHTPIFFACGVVMPAFTGKSARDVLATALVSRENGNDEP